MSFAFMIDQIFADPVMGRDALYQPQTGGAPYPVRAIIVRPDAVAAFGDTHVQATTNFIEVKTVDVDAPVEGDSLTIDGQAYIIMGEPRADRERLVWRLNVYTVPGGDTG